MKTKLGRLIGIVALGVGFVASTTAHAQTNTSPQKARPINFKTGMSFRILWNQLTRKRSHLYYTVKVKANQHLHIQATPYYRGQGMIPAINITAPSGEVFTVKSGPFDTRSSEAGKYLIDVSQNQMASNSANGEFLLKVSAN